MTEQERQDDRLLATRIERAVAKVDPEVPASLANVIARGRRIRRRRRVELVVGVPAAVAAAVVITVVAVRQTSDPRLDVVVPATATPTPASQGSVLGHWVHHVIAEPRTGRVESVWVVRIDSPTRGTFQLKPRAQFGAGTMTYDAARRVWVVDVIGSRCGGRTGTYTLERFGEVLSFAHVDDDCAERVGILDSSLFEPATPDDEVPG